jgi:hypothetical protein
MGTRHLITIKKDGKIKVAQYGQWDGYPDGQGLDILKFLRNKIKVEELKHSLSKVRFLDREGIDKKFLEEYSKNAPEYSSSPDNRTDEQKFWFETFYSRDVGAKLLDNIISYDGEEIVLNEEIEGKKWCEGFFTIDLDNMKYRVEFHDWDETFDINNLPDEDDFLSKFKDEDDE